VPSLPSGLKRQLLLVQQEIRVVVSYFAQDAKVQQGVQTSRVTKEVLEMLHTSLGSAATILPSIASASRSSNSVGPASPRIDVRPSASGHYPACAAREGAPRPECAQERGPAGLHPGAYPDESWSRGAMQGAMHGQLAEAPPCGDPAATAMPLFAQLNPAKVVRPLTPPRVTPPRPVMATTAVQTATVVVCEANVAAELASPSVSTVTPGPRAASQVTSAPRSIASSGGGQVSSSGKRRSILPIVDGMPRSTLNFLLEACDDLQRASNEVATYADADRADDLNTAQEQLGSALQLVRNLLTRLI